MIRHIGDTSNLILDADLDTYYLMDITLIQLPPIQIELQKTLEIIDLENMNSSDFIKKTETINNIFLNIKNMSFPKIKDSMKTSIQENSNMYILSKTLKPNLENGFKQLEEDFNVFMNSILNNSNNKFTFKQININGIHAVNSAFQFQKIAIIELDNLLNKRIDLELSIVKNTIILSLGVILFSFIFSYLIITDITRKINTIKNVTYLIFHGDLTQRIKIKSKDEIGSLANAFNKMINKLNRYTGLQELLIEAGEKLGKSKIKEEVIIEFLKLLNRIIIINEESVIRFYIHSNNDEKNDVILFNINLENKNFKIKQISNISKNDFNYEISGIEFNKTPFIHNENFYIPIYTQSYLKTLFVISHFHSELTQEIKNTLLSLCSTFEICLDNIEYYERIKKIALANAEMVAAKSVQEALLPIKTIAKGAVEFATYYESAIHVGGDWYGHHHDTKNDTLFLCIGDVTGHGIPSALISGVACGAIYALCAKYSYQDEKDFPIDQKLIQLTKIVNSVLFLTGAKCDRLMTMLFIFLDLKNGDLYYINCGHTHPYWLDIQHGVVKTLPASGNRLGYKEDITPEVHKLTISKNDIIFTYTDGLVENHDSEGKILNTNELKKHLLKYHAEGVTTILEKTINLCKTTWKGAPMDDDYSILSFQWLDKS